MNCGRFAGLMVLMGLCWMNDRRLAWADPVSKPISSTSSAPDQRQEMDRRVQQEIRDLSSDNFKTREAASAQLRKLGWPAMSSLIVGAADLTDEEAKTRLAGIIGEISLTHTGLTEKTAALMKKYQDADSTTRRKMVDEGVDSADGNFIVAQSRVLAAGDYSSRVGDNRGQFLERNEKSLRKAEAWDELEWDMITQALLDQGGASDVIRPRIIRLVKERGNGASLGRALMGLRKIQPQGQYQFGFDEFIMQLLVASGDAEETLKAAETTGVYGSFGRLLLLSESRDWGAISKMPTGAKNENLFDRAAALQFMGQRGAAEALMKFDGKPFEENAINFTGYHPMLLGRMDLSNQLYVAQADYLDAVRFLILQRRYADALGIIEKAKAAHDGQAVAVEAQMIPVFARLHDVDRARALIKSLGTDSAEMNRGWVKEATDEANAILDEPGGGKAGPSPDVLGLFRKRAVEAGIWITLLKNDAGGMPAALKETTRILNDKPTPEEITRLSDHFPDLGNESVGADETLYGENKLYQAYILHKCGRKDLAERALKDAIAGLHGKRFVAAEYGEMDDFWPESPLESIVLLNDWKFCRPLLETLSAPEGSDPVFRYLHGLCLQKLGENESGAKVVKEAEADLDAHMNIRFYLMNLLRRAGETQLARKQG